VSDNVDVNRVMMPVSTVIGWLDDEITELTDTVKDQPESIKAVVGFTIDHLHHMKTVLLKNVQNMHEGKP